MIKAVSFLSISQRTAGSLIKKTPDDHVNSRYDPEKEIKKDPGLIRKYPDGRGFSERYVFPDGWNRPGSASSYPFGSYRSGIADEKYGFTGKEFDSDTGLYYYGARYYNPEIFVFTQADSVLPDVYNPQELNRYSYCLNNPLKYEDPDGHVPFLVVTATFGALAGAAISGGIEAYRQIKSTGQISDWKSVGKASLIGGVAGGIAGLTLGAGTSLIATGTVAASTAAVTGGMTSIVGTGVTAEGIIIYAKLGAAGKRALKASAGYNL